MRVTTVIMGAALLGSILVVAGLGVAQESPPPAASVTEAPETLARAALAEMEFLVGEWVGEGWAVTRSGERARFWVEESYRYRGDTDLMDMEGRFGDILPDGSRTEELEYDLGILYYDVGEKAYKMWHYSSDGEVFTVTMNVDVTARTMHYTKEYSGGRVGTFRLVIDEAGVWITTFQLRQPDGSWRQVMEFRMRRVEP